MHLFFHNLGYISSAILGFSLAFFVYIRDRKKIANRLYFLNNITFVVFIFGELMGTNTYDPVTSARYFFFTLINVLTVAISAHLAFAMFNMLKRQRTAIITIYTGAIALFIFFITDPSRFLLPSRPELYLPNYYNPGQYYWLFTAYFSVVVLYFFFVLLRSYRSSDRINKNRIKYFLLSYGFGYGIGSIGFLLTYGIKVDPLYASFLGLYTIPLAYSVLKYDLLDIHIVAKNALQYAAGTCGVGLLLIGTNVLNNYLTGTNPYFPFWLIPLASGVIVVLVGILVWKQIRETDLLKYEFINNISHKFRTPLTHIRWLAEELRTQNDQSEKNRAVQQIQYASMRLFELTNIVIDVARDDNDTYLYHFSPLQLQDILTELHSNHMEEITRKNLTVIFDIEPHLPLVQADKTRMQFALQILFENALVYTPEGGKVTVSLKKVGDLLRVSIKDNGIGISPTEIQHVFTKFYRATNARRTDTEGMGIGLSMAKSIIEKHHGQISAESQGEDKGSTFTFSLPVQAV